MYFINILIAFTVARVHRIYFSLASNSLNDLFRLKDDTHSNNDTKFTLLNKFYRPSPKGCTVDDVARLTEKFFSLGKDFSNCPKEDWLQDMASVSHRTSNRKRLFINIGFNKGYNFAIWMSIFAPETGMNITKWYNALLHYGIRDCGMCSECKETSNNLIHNSTSLSNFSASESSDIILVGCLLYTSPSPRD